MEILVSNSFLYASLIVLTSPRHTKPVFFYPFTYENNILALQSALIKTKVDHAGFHVQHFAVYFCLDHSKLVVVKMVGTWNFYQTSCSSPNAPTLHYIHLLGAA